MARFAASYILQDACVILLDKRKVKGMSVFNKQFKDHIVESIEYFNGLDRHHQAYIVANLSDLDEQDEKGLQPVLVSISHDIVNYDRTTIAQQLFEFGMDQTYATLLVENVVRQTPTLEYDLGEIAKIPDTDFEDKFSNCVTDIWVERKAPGLISKEHGLTVAQVRIITSITRHFMNGLARSQLSPRKITALCKSSGFSRAKIKILHNTLGIHAEFWRNASMYMSIQDSYSLLQKISEQNNLILGALQNLLDRNSN